MPLPRLTSVLLFALLLAASPALAQGADPQLPAIREALAAAERGDLDAGARPQLAAHPLYGWVEYAALRRNIDRLPADQARAFLQRHPGDAVGQAFRELWLAATARRQDWPAFLAAWRPGIKAVALRCAELDARQATGRADAQWVADAQALWRTGESLPDACDAPFAVLAAKGGLPPALRWERIELAIDAGNPGVIRAAARGLAKDEQALANAYAGFLDKIDDSALAWPKTARSRRVAAAGLARLAKSDPDRAEALLPSYAAALGFGDAERNAVLYQIALWTVASYLPESARRLAAVPEAAYDDRLREWRAREAMARSDWPAALAAIRKMPESQRRDSRWTYFAARLSELTGDKAGAQALYRQAAREPEFHGFLAADRIGAPYALCPWLPADDDAGRAVVARDPAIVRAMGLYAIDRAGWAQREWDEALSRFDDTQRRLAVEVAQDHGWFDRAVFSLGRTPEERRLYTLRFPLHHDATIRRAALENDLDPAWVAAEIRAESVFNPNARSAANAMGLMQVLPTTGMAVARRLGLAWGGAQSLYDPDTNIVLGTAYLRQLLDKYGGQPYFAIAGYNAGPTPLARWQAQRPGMDPDFWIETISYKETRDYVARVLAFSAIYDWRLNGNALPLSERMRGNLQAPRKAFACPLAQPPADAPPAPAPAPAAKPAQPATRSR
ncbi:MAG TPA: transglycosylase SLT domain-containing protein [Xanthomonadaceae bacterium]|nr:transglycosylase SLT domain-containing protein [Xanthomonadaceae bacterium]